MFNLYIYIQLSSWNILFFFLLFFGNTHTHTEEDNIRFHVKIHLGHGLVDEHVGIFANEKDAALAADYGVLAFGLSKTLLNFPNDVKGYETFSLETLFFFFLFLCHVVFFDLIPSRDPSIDFFLLFFSFFFTEY